MQIFANACDEWVITLIFKPARVRVVVHSWMLPQERFGHRGCPGQQLAGLLGEVAKALLQVRWRDGRFRLGCRLGPNAAALRCVSCFVGHS